MRVESYVVSCSWVNLQCYANVSDYQFLMALPCILQIDKDFSLQILISILVFIYQM